MSRSRRFLQGLEQEERTAVRAGEVYEENVCEEEGR